MKKLDLVAADILLLPVVGTALFMFAQTMPVIFKMQSPLLVWGLRLIFRRNRNR